MQYFLLGLPFHCLQVYWRPGCQKSLLPPRAFSLPLIVFGLGWTKKKTQVFSVRERYELSLPAL